MLVDRFSGLGRRDGVLTYGPQQSDLPPMLKLLREGYVRFRPETPNLPAVIPPPPAKLRIHRSRWLSPTVMIGWSRDTPLKIYRMETTR